MYIYSIRHHFHNYYFVPLASGALQVESAKKNMQVTVIIQLLMILIFMTVTLIVPGTQLLHCRTSLLY